VSPGLTPLADGRVLLTGNKKALLFDPQTDTWTATADLIVRRVYHVAVALPDGRVLVAGGIDWTYGGPSHMKESLVAEIYDPRTGTWTFGGVASSPHVFAAAAVVEGGNVLVVGGAKYHFTARPTMGIYFAAHPTVELFEPARLRWTVVDPLCEPRALHAATLLGDGSVLVTGGLPGIIDPATVESATAERYARPEEPSPTPHRPTGRNEP